MTYLNLSENQTPLTVSKLLQMKQAGEKISSLTAYDASFAALFDRIGIDIILIGDSLGNVIQGHSTTIPVSIEAMIYHTECVARAVKRSFVVSDLPFATYASVEDAIKNSASLMQAGAQMVKMEGGRHLAQTIEVLTRNGIPVCAHLGLTPQSVNTLGGFKVQGKSEEAAKIILEDARILESAGAQLLVIEAIPSALGKEITDALTMPTIGIGAGPDCSGQVLVMHDALGAFPGRKPKFVKDFLAATGTIDKAVALYIEEVKKGAFPAPEHCFKSN
jgi:3-methyl-2-oxobutanoate hydroxymethyltransferase